MVTYATPPMEKRRKKTKLSTLFIIINIINNKNKHTNKSQLNQSSKNITSHGYEQPRHLLQNKKGVTLLSGSLL